MARTAVTITNISAQGGSIDVPTQAADATNDMDMVNDGRTIFEVFNDSAGVVNVTIVSVADPYGRTQNLALAIAATKKAFVGPLLPAIWSQAGGKVNIDFDVDTTITVRAIRVNFQR